MVGIALWAARLLLLFMIMRLLQSLLFKKGPSAFSGKPKEEIKRFKGDSDKVVDADFKEL
jgi:hypothetical protein